MKILVLANRDIYANLAVNQLVSALDAHETTLWISDRVGGKRTLPAPLVELRFFEQQLFNNVMFPALGQRNGELLSFTQLAAHFGSPLTVCNAINGQKALLALRKLAPDLVVSIRYGCILRPESIAVPRVGVLNLHSGLLPDYRGVMATFWAMLAGESHIGTTLHWIQDEGIDTGDILGTTSMALDHGRSYFGNVLRLYGAGCDLLADAIGRIARKLPPATVRPQGSGGGYFSFPDAPALADFNSAGLRLFDVDEVLALTGRYLPCSPGESGSRDCR